MNEYLTYKGYHGTSVQAYELIKKKGFSSEKRKDHWLGQGIYFFDNDYDQAKIFSNHCKRVKKNNENPCVLVAEIVSDKVMDLDTSKGRKLFGKYFDEMSNYLKEHKMKINVKGHANNKEIACLALNYINSDQVEVIVRVFEIKRNYVKEPEMIFPATHKQICVRQNSCIHNLRKIERGECCGC